MGGDRRGREVVLITGCSTGIGRAAAVRLARRGFTVYATARRLESIADLEPQGCRILSLDVDDLDSMESAVRDVEAAEGAVGILVNNAGYGLQGAVESLPLESIRDQFETNFFGPVALAQLVLPGMRARGSGRIVNVTSMGGRLVLPAGGAYHASKYALEALSDALRYEVRPFGVDVVLIEPGLIRTGWGRTAIGTGDELAGDDVYGEFNAGSNRLVHTAYEGRMSRFAAEPDAVARVIERAIRARRPRARYPVTVGARTLILLKRVLPDRVFDAMLRRVYPQPRPKAVQD